MAVSLGSGPDDVTIQVGSNRFVGWQNVSISRSCESMPNNWSLTASAEFLQGAALAGTRPGQSCLIYIGSDLVITGKIDRRSIPIDARNHQVTLSGRGITRNLVDCSADLLNDPGIRGGQINGANALDVAAKLCKAYGITARSAVSDLGIAIPSFQVPLGETPYQIIESVARTDLVVPPHSQPVASIEKIGLDLSGLMQNGADQDKARLFDVKHCMSLKAEATKTGRDL